MSRLLCFSAIETAGVQRQRPHDSGCRTSGKRLQIHQRLITFDNVKKSIDLTLHEFF